MELNKIYLGDCLEVMKDIPDKSVDMILCDLPYGTTKCKWDVIIPFVPLWEHYNRVVKDRGAIVLTASQPFTSMLIMSNTDMFKYEWIWDKRKPTGHLNSKFQPLKQHESVLVFSKNRCTYNPVMHTNRLQRDFNGKVRYGSVGETQSDNYGKQYMYVSAVSKESLSYPRTIISISAVINNSKVKAAHPTQKPVALFEYLIKTYTNEGETVLDNCIGSGTTAIACIKTNRNFIGIEKDEGYFNLANKRVKEEYSNYKLAI